MPPPPAAATSAAAAAIPDDSKRQAAREVIDILHDISTLLPEGVQPNLSSATYKNTHLDRTQLSLCVSLIENGVNPEALADVVRELRKESEKGSAGAGAAEGK